MTNKKHSVLVIEDNEINREILNEILCEDYNLYFAENGKIGLDLMRQKQNELDIVLLDLQMPVMTGYEVLEAVRDDSQLQRIPIIVITANEGSDEEERCLKLHAADFLRKPYVPTMVRLRVEGLIRLRECVSQVSELETDLKTGAYTYNAFMFYASQKLNQNPEVDYTLAMTDIIGFKALVESYGDRAFDTLKKQVDHTKKALNNDVIIGYFSFDHLLFFFPTPKLGLSQEQKQEHLDNLFCRMSKDLKVTVKAGFCEHIDPARSLQSYFDVLLLALDKALKHYNHYCTFVGSQQLDQIQRARRIEQEMEEAIKNGQMQVYYQPKHDAKSQKLIGAEALLRWIHPELGFISPAEFIPIFEQNGFVDRADAFVWEQTCKYQRGWIDKGLSVVPISVNASRQDFDMSDIEARTINLVHKYNLSPSLMHVEVTESFFADLSAEAIQRMKNIRENGIKVELDDFGTGYSSLHSLAELPIDIVKFDMSFVRRLREPREQVVMKGCVDLIKRLEMETVAEGVEDADIRDMIADIGIDAIQGYYYSKPLPADQFEEYLKKSTNG